MVPLSNCNIVDSRPYGVGWPTESVNWQSVSLSTGYYLQTLPSLSLPWSRVPAALELRDLSTLQANELGWLLAYWVRDIL